MSKQISLTQGKVAIVDEDDFELLKQYKWFARFNKDSYTFYAINNDVGSMHRMIANPSKSEIVDHINHNGLDNRKINLRKVSHSQNMMNRRVQKNSISGIPGVAFRKNDKTWEARIKKDGKTIHLGTFKNKEDAITARKEAENIYFGEFAYGGNYE